MAFSRALAPSVEPSSDHLTAAMVGIGFGFAAAPAAVEPNIEDTLLFASVLAMERADLRVLAMLMTWWGVHHERVNADRLTKLAAAHPAARVRALWSALATWKSKDRRFARLQKVYTGPRVDASSSGTAFQIGRHGEDARLEGSALRAAASLLRDRAADILSPQQLALHHHAYRWRIIIGPSFRADMWAVLEGEPGVSVADLARRAYGSFATAWQVKRDFALIGGGSSTRRRAASSRAR
jgi:hypothetical protein